MLLLFTGLLLVLERRQDGMDMVSGLHLFLLLFFSTLFMEPVHEAHVHQLKSSVNPILLIFYGGFTT